MWILQIFLFSLITLIFTECDGAESKSVPTIKTAAGRVSGVTEKSFFGKEYLAYYGIPFAEPPIGNLRFKVSFGKIIHL